MNEAVQAENFVFSEYQDRSINLTNEDFQFIKNKVNNRTGERVEVKPLSIEDNNFIIRSKGYVGVVKLPSGKRLQIKPKIGNLKLLKILNYYSFEEEILDIDGETIFKEGAEFLDMLGWLLQREVKTILNRGLHKTYVKREEKSKYIKGKIDIEKQINSPLKNKFFIEYEDISKDNRLNKLIFRALDILKKIVGNRDLKKEMSLQGKKVRKEVDVEKISLGNLKNIETDPLSAYYDRAVRISKLVIRNVYYESLKYGKAPAYCFLLDMNEIFEKFVRKLIGEILPDRTVRKPRRGGVDNIISPPDFQIVPDILIEGEEGLEYVGDVKYKKEKRGGKSLTSSDYYQAISYGLATDCDGFLVYPSRSDEWQPYEVENSERTIHRLPIDISGAGEESYIDDVKEECEEKIRHLKLLRG